VPYRPASQSKLFGISGSLIRGLAQAIRQFRPSAPPLISLSKQHGSKFKKERTGLVGPALGKSATAELRFRLTDQRCGKANFGGLLRKN
jgi:hypothetical protein